MGVPAAALRTNSSLVAHDPPKRLLNAANNQSRTQLIEVIKENVMTWTRWNQTDADRTEKPKLPGRTSHAER
jgi:hypothetical protein